MNKAINIFLSKLNKLQYKNNLLLFQMVILSKFNENDIIIIINDEVFY